MSKGTQRRLAAIVAVDVAAYSRLIGADEEGTLEALRAHRRELIDPTIETHNGRIANTAGDSLLLEFSSVVDAVRCAVAIQDGLAERNADVPYDRHILMRIGINVGDVVAEGGDLLGDGVNIAARLEGLAVPGGICISGGAHEQVRDRIDIAFEDLGEQEVKNIERPVHVWQWRLSEIATEHISSDEPDKSLSLPNKPSIAVLPFENLSSDAEQEFFADGMTEDIITELSHFEYLFVIARNTTFTYKGKHVDVQQVARELGVQYVLEGSVRKVGSRVRITAQLIDGTDGKHIWAERYDGAVENVFDLQDDVTRQVVSSLARQVFATQLDRAGRSALVFDASHELGWQARDRMRAAFSERDPSYLEEAIEMSKKAVAMNAKCAIAYSTLCFAHNMQSLYRWGSDPDSATEKALNWAEKFVAELPNSHMAYGSLGGTKNRLGLYEDAICDFERAHELNPNESLILYNWSLCEAAAGYCESAKKHAHMGLRLSPKDYMSQLACLALAMVAFIEQDDKAFEEWGNKAIQRAPTAPIRRAMMMAYAAKIGNQGLLERHHTELMQFAPHFIASLFRGENKPFHHSEHMAMLLDGLRKAGFSE